MFRIWNKDKKKLLPRLHNFHPADHWKWLHSYKLSFSNYGSHKDALSSGSQFPLSSLLTLGPGLCVISGSCGTLFQRFTVIFKTSQVSEFKLQTISSSGMDGTPRPRIPLTQFSKPNMTSHNLSIQNNSTLF